LRPRKSKPLNERMARIAYKPEDLNEPKEVVASIRARRGGRLLELDRMLLHSPAFARGWNAHLGAVRSELTVPAKLRELAICAVAVLNGAEYEFLHHAPEFAKAGGTQAQLDALRKLTPTGVDLAPFDAVDRAVIALTTEMTRAVRVSDATFAGAQTVLPNDQQLIELIGIIASYNMVSRFLVALQIAPES
jgi:alkylhydroperoxidase family enzyme